MLVLVLVPLMLYGIIEYLSVIEVAVFFNLPETVFAIFPVRILINSVIIILALLVVAIWEGGGCGGGSASGNASSLVSFEILSVIQYCMFPFVFMICWRMQRYVYLVPLYVLAVVLFVVIFVGNTVSGAVGDVDEPIGEADGAAIDADVTGNINGALAGVDVTADIGEISGDNLGIPLRIFGEIPKSSVEGVICAVADGAKDET